LSGHTRSVNSVAFDPTGRFVVTGSWDNTAKLWRMSSEDETTWNCVATLAGHTCAIESVAFDPTGLFLVTGSQDNTAKVWQVSRDGAVDQSPVSTLAGHSNFVVSVAFDPTGRFVVTGSHDRTAKVWRVSPDSAVAPVVSTLSGHTRSVNSVAFHPTGHFVATGSNDKTVKIWVLNHDKSIVKCIDTINHRDRVLQVKFDPLGKFLAIVLDDGSLILYDCSGLNNTALRLKLLETQAMAGLVATRLSGHPDIHLNINSSKVAQDITDKVNAENLALYVPLVTSEEAQSKVKKKTNQFGRGGKISKRKRKINKHYSYRK